MKTGKYVKRMRLQKNLSQENLGKLINKPVSRICELENDLYTIKRSVFMEMATALKITNFNKILKD
jgi:transcriptional regulator with XRE-family HTH domain